MKASNIWVGVGFITKIALFVTIDTYLVAFISIWMLIKRGNSIYPIDIPFK